MMPRSLLAVFVLLIPQGAIAQNLLVNPRFDADLSGWTATPAGTHWSPLDADSSGVSGSADLFATGFTSACQLSTISQCLPATGTAYDFAGAARFGGPYDGFGLAFLLGDQFAGDAIQGAGLGFSGSAAPRGAWTTFSGRARRPSESHVMLVTASALACGCVLGHCNTTESWFDNFSLTVAPPPVPARFYTVTPCRLLDTRSVPGGEIQAQTERKVSALGICGIPQTAKALALNLPVPEAGCLET